MKSHTVPRRLLRQFSYFDATTKSERLWRYQKGKPPSPKASPKTAARVDGHFENPIDAAQEALIEQRLANEVEGPVNRLFDGLNDPAFTFTEDRRRPLTRYITLLFNRSMARRNATQHIISVRNYALQQFLQNDVQLMTVATHWNLDAFFRGLNFGRLFTPTDVAGAAVRYIAADPTGSSLQESYSQSIIHAMTQFDEAMFLGEWRRIYTSPDKPFIVSDAPVITWTRNRQGSLAYGAGFNTQNVEVILPISPTTCLHMLPNVRRSESPMVPTVDDVNAAQAAYATASCFCNIGSQEIDAIVQSRISTVVLGENVFTVWHMPYQNLVYDILMGRRLLGRRS